MPRLSGYLLAWPNSQEIARDHLEVEATGRNSAPALAFVGQVHELQRWEEYELLSDTPLADEEFSSQNGEGIYRYKVICVRSGAKIIVLSDRRKIVDYLLSRILDRRIFPNLRKVRMFIGKLIASCAMSDSEYLITSLHGRFSGSERHLRTISLYGDDVTESAVYRDHHYLFNFYSCGVGRRLFDNLPRLSPSDDGEIILLGNDGFISLFLQSRESALEAMRVISFVISNRWVEDWVPNVGME